LENLNPLTRGEKPPHKKRSILAGDSFLGKDGFKVPPPQKRENLNPLTRGEKPPHKKRSILAGESFLGKDGCKVPPPKKGNI
jgi:hypothetical protein